MPTSWRVRSTHDPSSSYATPPQRLPLMPTPSGCRWLVPSIALVDESVVAVVFLLPITVVAIFDAHVLDTHICTFCCFQHSALRLSALREREAATSGGSASGHLPTLGLPLLLIHGAHSSRCLPNVPLRPSHSLVDAVRLAAIVLGSCAMR